jgi:signal recognition particle receptor subunit beta
MVFFNYSTMQMAAKVVYYGPGLCGKTTNLHYIYAHTTNDSRGEMVSLETETDRTLFFDLLPIDVGSIAGFNTRIQLYTVPGQVFYNTTRKLVLKGVDGVVFVVDSQRAMQQANLDSFRNLEDNLTEMGLNVDSLPLVLQYNKRDLADIYSLDELNRNINRNNWPYYEASALAGQGVFETLKGISKFTLLSLKKRLGRSGAEAQPQPARVQSARGAAPVPPPPPVRPLAHAAPPPAAVPERPAPGAPAVAKPNEVALHPPAATSAPPRPTTRPPGPAPAPPAPTAGTTTSTRLRSVDVLGELEKLRREAMQPSGSSASAPAPPRPAKPAVSGAHAKAATNGRMELSRNIEMTLRRSDLARAKRFSVSFQVEDDQQRVVDSVKDLKVEIQGGTSLEKLLLHLNIALHAKE